MPTETEMDDMRLALIAKAEQINDQDLIVAQKRVDLVQKDAQVETIDADLLNTILNARFTINNRLMYTNDDQRRIQLIIARNASQTYVTNFAQKNTLILEKDSAFAEAARLRRIYRPDELMMRYYANQTEATVEPQPTTQPPLTPTNFVGTVISSTQINVSATASQGATGYILRRGLDEAFLSFVDFPLTQPSKNDTGRSPSTEYFYKMKATNASGESAFTATLTKTTQAAPPPAGSYICASVRVFPRAGFSDRLESAQIQGSNTSPTAGFVTIGTLPASGFTDAWRTIALDNNTTFYKYLRLYIVTGNWGAVSEVEFRTASGAVIPATSYFGDNWFNAPDPQYDFNKAFDGDTSTFFSSNSNPTYVGIEVANS